MQGHKNMQELEQYLNTTLIGRAHVKRTKQAFNEPGGKSCAIGSAFSVLVYEFAFPSISNHTDMCSINCIFDI